MTQPSEDTVDELRQRIDKAMSTLALMEQTSLAKMREVTSPPTGNSYLTGVHDACFTALNAVRCALHPLR